jgi:hypothetical protein
MGAFPLRQFLELPLSARRAPRSAMVFQDFTKGLAADVGWQPDQGCLKPITFLW